MGESPDMQITSERQIADNPTDKVKVVKKTSESGAAVPKAPIPAPGVVEGIVETRAKTSIIQIPEVFPPAQTPQPGVTGARPISKQEKEKVAALQERCRQLCLSLFFRNHSPVRSLGFTSSIHGEGKSFLATVMANVLARDSSDPVILLECNWEHTSLFESFGIPATPGLAEWLRGECSETTFRHQFDHNLTIIPAGNGKRDAVRLLKHIQQKGLPDILTRSNELLIVDLPPVVTSAYGALAASLVDALLIVVRSGVTTELMVAETFQQLKGLPIEGVIFNQVESRIPRWIRQML